MRPKSPMRYEDIPKYAVSQLLYDDGFEIQHPLLSFPHSANVRMKLQLCLFSGTNRIKKIKYGIKIEKKLKRTYYIKYTHKYIKNKHIYTCNQMRSMR